MLEPPGVTLRERREKREEKVEDDRRAPGGGFSYGGRGGTFLDNISALGSDDPYGADQHEKPPRGPGRGGRAEVVVGHLPRIVVRSDVDPPHPPRSQ